MYNFKLDQYNLIRKNEMSMRPTLYKEIFAQTSGARKLMSAPFIYGMIFPLVFLDICIEIYHHIGFRLYKLPIVNRGEYIFLDRHKLAKLKFMQRINCVYCGYANGLLAYGVKIAGETEKFWCSIKHDDPIALENMPHQKEFYEPSQFE